MSTALQAYFWLERHGYIEPRPRSGFYVRVPFKELIREPKYREHEAVPTTVGTATIIHEVVQMAAHPSMIPFGAAFPGPGVLATQLLNRALRKIVNRIPSHSVTYDLPEASEAFRRQIARHSLSHGCNFSPEEIVTTCGALEALNLCLRAAAKPADVVAIESPTYFGVLQAIQSLGMRAVEIPTYPRNGMCLDELEKAIRKHDIKACVVMPNCHNPMGYIVPEDKKKAFVELTNLHDISVIEDDVYGDLAFAGRARTLKSHDRKGLVLLCSSFSKVLAPGLRIGWVHAGRFHDEVEKLKYVTTIASPTLAQLAVAGCMQTGGYERYLRKLRGVFSDRVQSASVAVAKYFPEGTRMTRPAAATCSGSSYRRKWMVSAFTARRCKRMSVSCPARSFLRVAVSETTFASVATNHGRKNWTRRYRPSARSAASKSEAKARWPNILSNRATFGPH
jgi:DNA-binding transcriptional MocR family regulator